LSPPWVKSAVLTARRSLPVYPDKQTFSVSVGMSQRGHNRTHALQQTGLLNHLVGASNDRRWDCEPKGLSGSEIDDQLELRWLHR
jgi:hypothetical protein